jgi:O-antigen ligase
VLRRDTRLLDAALLGLVAVGAGQLMPLPPAIHDLLSPAGRSFQTTLVLIPPSASTWLPLSLAPVETADALGVLVAAVCLFWVTRDVARSRGARVIARAVAWMGLAAALLAFTGSALFPNGKLYGLWQPYYVESRPVGPIISKNHFAAWMILGVSLTAGYLAAHVQSRWKSGRQRLSARFLSDTRSLWLVAAGALMLAGLIVTMSRSGAIGIGVAFVFAIVRAWRRLSAGGRAGVVVYLLVLVAAVALWSRPQGVSERLGNSVSDEWGGRPAIWRQTMAMSRQYLVAGVGLGTFDVAMSVYQPMPRPALVNHAHNQYLQILTEGGLLMALPALLAGFAFFGLVSRQIRADDTPLVSLRQGALAGLIGIGTQSLWETPLLTPAVFLLFAVAAGIAVHARHEDEVTG